MKNEERVFETGMKSHPVGIKFERGEVDNHSYVLEDKHGKKETIIYLSKEVAEKYLAQLRSALEDLDRTAEEFKGGA